MRAILYTLALMSCATRASADVYVLVVSGLGGAPQFEQRFVEQAEAMNQAALSVTDAAKVTLLKSEHATREAITATIRAIARQTQAKDQFVLMLIGHGSFDGEDYRFNIPGPDITARELGSLLDAVPARQLIVNATSASGAVLDRWKKLGRVLITATKSGDERNATRFAQFWVQALSSAEADRDKNEIVTAAEAYEYAGRKVADTFKSDVAIATEHAQLAGDSADRFVVARLGAAAVMSNDPELAVLQTQQAAAERSLDDLKTRKQTLATQAYYNELESVLVSIARVDQRIAARQSVLNNVSGGSNARPR